MSQILSAAQARHHLSADRLRDRVEASLQATRAQDSSDTDLNREAGDVMVLSAKGPIGYADSHLRFDPATGQATDYRSESYNEKLSFTRSGDQLTYRSESDDTVQTAVYSGGDVQFKQWSQASRPADRDGRTFISAQEIGHFPDLETARAWKDATGLMERISDTAKTAAEISSQSTVPGVASVDGAPDPRAKVPEGYDKASYLTLTGQVVTAPESGQLVAADLTTTHCYGNGYDFRREAVESSGGQTVYSHEMQQNWNHPHRNLFFETVTVDQRTGDIIHDRKHVDVALFGPGTHFQEPSNLPPFKDPELARLAPVGLGTRAAEWLFTKLNP